MTFDPYAPPSPAPYDAAPSPTPAHAAAQRFEASEVVGLAWGHLKGNAGLLIGGSALWLSLRGAASYGPAGLVGAHLSPSVASQVVLLFAMIASQALGGFMTNGFAHVGLAVARRETPSFGAFFATKGAGRNIGLGLLLGLGGTISSLVRIVSIVGMEATGIDEIGLLPGVWNMIAIVPMIWISLAISMTPFFIVDRDMPLGDAIRASFEATRGKRGDIFVTSLLGVLVVLAGAVACGIGIFASYPIFAMLFPIVYLRLTGQDAAYAAKTAGYSAFQGGFGGPGGGYGPPPAGGYGAPPGYGPPPGTS